MTISANFSALKPSLLLDFANVERLDPRITFTRASNATYFDANGVMQTASNGVARFDHSPTTLQSLGLLIEEQRTNSIRNNTMQGAVAGTPGTLPTNWTYQEIGAELTSAVVGTGTENGITYIDIRVSGTVTAQRSALIFFDTTTGIAASASQSWTESLYVKLQAGSTANIEQINIRTDYYSSVPAFLSTTVSSALTVTSAALNTQRQSNSVTTPASTAFIQPILRVRSNASGAIDITLRIGLPQLEQGAFATSVIPTTGSAATRNADVASMTGTNFSSWYNQSVSTFYAEYSVDATSTSTQSSYAWGIRNTATSGFDGYGVRSTRNNTTSPSLVGRSGATAPGLNSNFGAVVADQVLKTAAVIDANLTLSVNSGLVSATNSVFGLNTQDELMIGTADAGGVGPYELNGHIRRIAYWGVRLDNSKLQALTT